MSLIYYFGKSNHSIVIFPEFFKSLYATSSIPELSFYTKVYWVAFGITVYFIIPWTYIRCRGEKLRDYGVRLPTSYSHMWIYVVMLVIVIIMAYLASFQQSFQNKYPYYKYFQEAPLLYGLFWVGRAVRFFALEFFFRGYLLFSLRDKMGDSAIFVSMVPYCMLHFGKPFSETIFAIVGGIIFCWIALRTKSIWGAVVLHVALAIAMDFFSIAQKLNWIG
jgi:membrane protease YdiL (CAAX protease family)